MTERSNESTPSTSPSIARVEGVAVTFDPSDFRDFIGQAGIAIYAAYAAAHVDNLTSEYDFVRLRERSFDEAEKLARVHHEGILARYWARLGNLKDHR